MYNNNNNHMSNNIYVKRPIISYLLYKYFGIETNSYKSWWKEYSYQLQLELESQPKNLHYSKFSN